MAAPTASAAATTRNRGIAFVAPDIAGAVTEIRDKLGSGAIILDVRRAPARGLSRLWQRPQVEVIACLPDPEESSAASPTREPVPALQPDPEFAPVSPAAAALIPRLAPRPTSTPDTRSAPATPVQTVPQREALQRYARARSANGATPDDGTPSAEPVPFVPPTVVKPVAEARERSGNGGAPAEWRWAGVLERLGILPRYAAQVVARMQELHGEGRPPPESLAQEVALARRALQLFWRTSSPGEGQGAAPLHVFVGPPGSGKSTALCKWMAQTLLIEGRPARAWRLDGRTANASEVVNLYGEILGVPVERVWNGRGDAGVAGFVDLAAADYHDAEAVDALGTTLARLGGATVHLVLNAAYSVPLLMTQTRAFSRLPIDDLVLTHLDEETSWGRLWNLVLGTNYPLSRLSAGQNIPGRFTVAQPEALCASLYTG